MLIPNLPAPLPVDWLRRVGIEKIGPVSSVPTSVIRPNDVYYSTVFADATFVQGLEPDCDP